MPGASGSASPPIASTPGLFSATRRASDADHFVEGLQAAYPDAAIIGGMASGLIYSAETFLFLNDQSFSSGAVICGIGGAYTVKTLVTHGVKPIGSAGTVTDVQQNLIKQIEGRPAYEVMRETIDALPEEERWDAQEKLLIGLPSGSEVVVRGVLGADRRSGAIAVDALPQSDRPSSSTSTIPRPPTLTSVEP